MIKVYPVVHVQGVEQAAYSALEALDEGADGVFVADYRSVTDQEEVLDTLATIKQNFPDGYVGVKLSSYPDPDEAYEFIYNDTSQGMFGYYPDALWIDDVSTPGINPLRSLERVRELRKGDDGIRGIPLFGGIACKYSETYTEDPADAALYARQYGRYVDVITTSGMHAGDPPSIDKIAAMKQAMPGTPLAIASGISAENVGEYADWADAVLVASSIQKSNMSGMSGEFDLKKIRELIAIAHEL